MNLDYWFSTYPYNLILLIAIGLGFIFALVALILAIRARNRISKMLNGKQAEDIDDILVQIYKNLSMLDNFKNKTRAEIVDINERLARSIQSVETIRFNPFKGTGAGGNQSFAIALINENGDGIVLSSLYASDRMSMYAKPLKDFESTFELSEEEQQALEKAVERLG